MATYTLTGDLGTLVGGDFEPDNIRASLAASGFVLAGTEARFGGVPIDVDDDGTFTLTGIPEAASPTYTFTAMYRTPTMPVVLETRVVGPFALTADTDLEDVIPAPPGSVDPVVTYADVQAVLALGVTDDTIIAAKLNDGTSATRAATDVLFGIPLAGTGIDPTGAVDSTTAVQAKLTAASAVGGDVYVPASAVLKLTDTLTISGRVTLRGPGELRWTSGIAAKPAILVTAEGCVIENVKMTNPNSLGNQSGNSNYGILVRAHNFRATGNWVEKFQYGIAVDANGEWGNIVINNNRIKDVLGAGDGAASGSSNGEDRGDGITVWGCQASIVGNVVNALSGTDARIGIHAEGLPSFEGAETPPHKSAMVTISGNVVYGKFRRGIMTEDIHQAAIAANVVADATWWGIASGSAIVNTAAVSRSVSITGNTVKWTRLSTDNHGSAFSPTRCPITLYGSIVGASVTGNTIEVQATGVAKAFILAQGTGSTIYPQDCVIANNVGRIVTGGAVEIGVFLDTYSRSMKIANNILRGFTAYGVYGYTAFRVSILGNEIVGSGAPAAKGIALENDASTEPVIANGNAISGCPTVGFYRYNAQYTLANNNIIEGSTTAFDWFGATNSKAVGNLIIGATTAHANQAGSVLTTD